MHDFVFICVFVVIESKPQNQQCNIPINKGYLFPDILMYPSHGSSSPEFVNGCRVAIYNYSLAQKWQTMLKKKWDHNKKCESNSTTTSKDKRK